MSNLSLSQSKLLLIVLCLFGFFVESLTGFRCIQSPAEKWRLCKPNKQEANGECRCHGIHLNNRGSSDCSSRASNTPFCYVVDEMSGCPDKTASAFTQTFPAEWNGTISYSDIACESENRIKLEIGNEDYLPGVEIEDQLTEYFKKFSSDSWEECQMECQDKFFCKAWSFLEGTCKLMGAETCCDQINRKKVNPKAVSGFNCAKDYPGLIGCWSTMAACPPCPKEKIPDDWQRCLDDKKLLWSPTNECFPAIEQGPCQADEWLVLKDDLPGPTLESVCVKKKSLSEDDSCDGEPRCLQNEVVVFSKFGHPVCHCDSDHYPLADLELYSELPRNKRCFKMGDNSTCSAGLTLWLKEDDDNHLECKDQIVPLTVFSTIKGSKCKPGQLKAFGRCQPGRRRR